MGGNGARGPRGRIFWPCFSPRRVGASVARLHRAAAPADQQGDCGGPDHSRRQILRLAESEGVTQVHVGSCTRPLPCCGNGGSCGAAFLPPNSLTVATKNTGTK